MAASSTPTTHSAVAENVHSCIKVHLPFLWLDARFRAKV
jgi:hypothetical protein